MKSALEINRHIFYCRLSVAAIIIPEMPQSKSIRVGLFAIGLNAYWPQFPGLRERLDRFTKTIAARVRRDGVELIDLGMVDSPDTAREAAHNFCRADIDLLLLHVSTYALSSTLLPILRRVKVPLLILNLSPEPAIDYERFNGLKDRAAMAGEWLSYCQACPLPEIANVLRRCHLPFFEITGTMQAGDEAWTELDEWLNAASVANVLANSTLGLMGHYYSGMLDVYCDLTQHCSVFGTHIEQLEVDELAAIRREISQPAIEEKIAEFRESFEIEDGCPSTELIRAAQTAAALDEFVHRYRLDFLAYYHKGTGLVENEEVMSSIILGTSLLTAAGVPTAGEYEVKNAHAMKIMDAFGCGGSFTEFYAVDYLEDVVLMGHDGPGHVTIANGKPKVRTLSAYHGKVGRGLSIEMSVKHGAVTLLSVIEGDNGNLKLLTAHADSVPGPILEIGNTNSRYRFRIGAKHFIREWNRNGPAHHCAIGVGHIATKIDKLAALLGIGHVHIC